MAKRKKALTYKEKGSTHSHKTKKRLAIKEEMLAKKASKGKNKKS